MMRPSRPCLYCSLVLAFLLITAFFACVQDARAELPNTVKADELMAKSRQKVEQDMRSRGFAIGQPIYIRIFKLPGVLELWMNKGKGFDLYKTYPICSYSGFPGPKVNEGDWQSPEGFYSVTGNQMNPNSQYHLAFDIGYPNDFDATKNRTGSLIMVHGDCQSVGCFAMGNNRIEEIYMLAYAALQNGQEQFGVHVFPFRPTPENMKKFAASPWIRFWKSLEPAYAAFEQSKQVPEVEVVNGEYVVKSKVTKLAMSHVAGESR